MPYGITGGYLDGFKVDERAPTWIRPEDCPVGYKVVPWYVTEVPLPTAIRMFPC